MVGGSQGAERGNQGGTEIDTHTNTRSHTSKHTRASFYCTGLLHSSGSSWHRLIILTHSYPLFFALYR